MGNGRSGEGSSTAAGRSGGRFTTLSFWCGVVVIGTGIFAATLAATDARSVTRLMGYLLACAGIAEAVAGFDGLHERGWRGRIDTLLGFMSMVAAAILLFGTHYSASSLVTTIMIWLLARGSGDILASAFMSSLLLEEGRLIRASIDFALGLLTFIGATTITWWELLVGWPASAVETVLLFAGISLAAAGTFLISEARDPMVGADGLEPPTLSV